MFNFGKNDWYPVWANSGDWTSHNRVWENCSFEILFSPSRNGYKLKVAGLRPKSHPMYQLAVRKLNEFIKNGHE